MKTGIQASMNPDAKFWKLLTWIKNQYRMKGTSEVLGLGSIDTSEGILGIDGPYDDSHLGDEGEYIRVGFVLPDGVYAEIDNGTYGTLNAFRIYKKDEE